MPRVDFRRPIFSLSAAAICLVATWWLLFFRARPAVDKMGSAVVPVYRYEAVTGFFLQDEAGTEPGDFDNLKSNFGLIDRPYDSDRPEDGGLLTPWQRFERHVQHLIEDAPKGTTYKVIYAGRHGEGDHNVAEAKYGTKAWDDYWSKLDGDGELYWFDAHLTALGEQQARDNHDFFGKQFGQAKMPAPQKYYVSPLFRCLQTANLSFAGLEVPEARPFHPVVKELLREVMGEHTCDKRSSRTVIHKAFPSWTIEPGFAEEDELWQPDHRETLAEHAKRTQVLLDDIFVHDSSTFISLTSHSGMTAALLHVIGHRDFRLPTGGLMPILVKATKTTS